MWIPSIIADKNIKVLFVSDFLECISFMQKCKSKKLVEEAQGLMEVLNNPVTHGYSPVFFQETEPAGDEAKYSTSDLQNSCR